MAEKLSPTEKKIALLIFLLILFLLIFGCSSAPKTVAPKVYYCPNKHIVSPEDIKTGIRDINKCLTCGAKFPFIGLSRGDGGGDGRGGNYYQKDRQKNYGPTSVFQSNTEVEVLAASGGFFKENDWGFTWFSWGYYAMDIDRDYVRSTWSNRFNYNN